MERIRYCADLSVRRGCGFALLAIATVLVGFSYDFLLAMKAAAILSSLLAATLAFKALRAPRTSYRSTETWVLLDRRHDLPEAHAQRIIMGVLGDAYWRHAELAFGCAALFAALALAVWLLFY